MGNKIFKGASLKFSTKGNRQYEAIGRFWDYCAGVYGLENLRGLGYNWTPDSIEYVMGLKGNESPEMDIIKRQYGDAVYKEVLLPKEGWQEYSGRRDSLSGLYDEIYENGPLTFEIETFSGDGFCEISVCRNLLDFEFVNECELDYVMGLYRGAIGQEGCVWNEDYPTREILLKDIEDGCLYGIRDNTGNFIAAAARDRDEEVDKLDCWSRELCPAGEVARLVVAPGYQNQGLGRMLLRCGMKILSQKRLKSLHFLVAKENTRAIRSYTALGFNRVGEADMFGCHFWCYEKKL